MHIMEHHLHKGCGSLNKQPTFPAIIVGKIGLSELVRIGLLFAVATSNDALKLPNLLKMVPLQMHGHPRIF